MKFKNRVLLIFTMLMFVLSGCNKNESYSANNNPPYNVRESFYKKSIEVMNYYTKNVNTRTLYKDEDNEFLLGYYRSTPSESTEEIMIKTSLTYLDLIYRDFDLNLKVNKDEEAKLKIKDFEEQLLEALKLMEIKKN